METCFLSVKNDYVVKYSMCTNMTFFQMNCGYKSYKYGNVFSRSNIHTPDTIPIMHTGILLNICVMNGGKLTFRQFASVAAYDYFGELVNNFLEEQNNEKALDVVEASFRVM